MMRSTCCWEISDIPISMMDDDGGRMRSRTSGWVERKKRVTLGEQRGFATRKTRINKSRSQDDDERSERMTEGVSG